MNTYEDHLRIIRNHSSAMELLPTGESAVLPKLSGIKAVLFDVYGTLFTSASGDIGTQKASMNPETFCQAMAEAGIPCTSGSEGIRCLQDTIETFHRDARGRGIEYPEVDITEVWRVVVDKLRTRGVIRTPVESIDFQTLSLCYEVRANPVWPMPGTKQCLSELAERGFILGLVSNGQWYTHLLFPALLGGTPEAFGIAESMQFYSYRDGHAKPSEYLFRQAADALAARGVQPEQVLHVGNDVLNDCRPAKAIGYYAALFAGDARSLRRRQGDSRTAAVTPDMVVLNLLDLVSCVSSDRK